MFLISIAYVDISGPLAYYYTANAKCVPGGPGFSYGYYLAVTSIMAGVGGCIGSVLFQKIQNWRFRTAFCITTLVQVVASLFDLVIINRWNLKAGLSDQATFLFGDAACQQIATMLALMPSVLLNSLLCPRGAEATVYAILAGFQNFGGIVSSVVGVWLTRQLGIQAGTGKGGKDCDFSRLSIGIVIAHVLLPIACIPLTFVLVPDWRMDDETAVEAESPPPSFCSPASSPRSSPHDSESTWESESPYVTMQYDTEDQRRADTNNGVDESTNAQIVMTGLLRQTT